jgi:hypothetical protein
VIIHDKKGEVIEYGPMFDIHTEFPFRQQFKLGLYDHALTPLDAIRVARFQLDYTFTYYRIDFVGVDPFNYEPGRPSFAINRNRLALFM